MVGNNTTIAICAATARSQVTPPQGVASHKPTAAIGSFGKALPPAMQQEELWSGYFDRYYKGNRVAARLFRTVGVKTRHGAVNPAHEDISQWGTAARMQRFGTEALPLGKEALSASLTAQGLREMTS